MTETENEVRDLLANHAGSLFSVFRELGINAPLTVRNILVAYNTYGDDFVTALEAHMQAEGSFQGKGKLGKFFQDALTAAQTAQEIKEGFSKESTEEPTPAPEEKKTIWGLSKPLFWGITASVSLFIMYLIISIAKK